MKTRSWIRLISALSLTLLMAPVCIAQDARKELKAGIKAYEEYEHDAAIEHFQNAVKLDDRLIVAKLDLAHAYAVLWAPGVDNQENNRAMQQALDAYNQVLAADPKNVTALQAIACIYLEVRKFDMARDYLKRLIEADPNQPGGYYAYAFMDWSMTFHDLYERRQKMGPKFALDGSQMSPPGLCAELKSLEGARIEEGLKMAQMAMEKGAAYFDAMEYAALLYQLRAATECSRKAYADDKAMAATYIERAMAVLRATHVRPSATPSDPDELSCPISLPLPPPPPPPPPRPGSYP